MRVASSLLAAVVAVAFAGCGPAEITGTGYVTMPSLAYVSPGVYAVSNLDPPWYFADGWYWGYDAGAWYRTAYLGGPRVRVTIVPPGLAHMPHPWTGMHGRPIAHISPPRVHHG